MVAELEALVAQLVESIPQFAVAIAILVGTLILSRIAARWAGRNVRKNIEDPNTRKFLRQAARYTVLVLGTLAALDQIPGIHISSFLAGVGIVGFTVGFALQDIARNFIAGLLLLMRQPFAVGDAVEIAGRPGSVLDITIRDTVIKTWDGVMEIIPNLDVYSNPIVNYSELPLRRQTILIGLGYGEDVDRAKRIIMEVVEGIEGVLDEPAPEIFTEEMGDTTLNLAARFWVNQQKHNLVTVRSNVVEAINTAAENENIDMPYPMQVVRLETELPWGSPLS